MREEQAERLAFNETANPMPDLLAEVNARIAECAAQADAGVETWEFVCECGSDGCQERVSMTSAEYDVLRLAGEPVLRSGHTVSRAAHARQRSEKLREEARALQAQARHQVSRAKKSTERVR